MDAPRPATPCPLCAADDAAPCWPAPPTAVVRCRRCGLRYVSPRLAPRVEDEAYYVERYVPEIAIHGAGADGPIRDIERYVPVGRLLDVGCALGDHLAAARSRGWAVVGVEPAPFAVRFARERHGLTVHQGTLDDIAGAVLLGESGDAGDFGDAGAVGAVGDVGDVGDVGAEGDEGDAAGGGGRFDAILMAEVIEHVPDPAATVRRAAALLRPGGVVWLSTPNAGGLAAAALGSAWDRIEPAGHLCYFDPPTLARLIAGAGLDLRAMNAIDLDVDALAARTAAAGRPVGRAVLAGRALARSAAVSAARAAARLGAPSRHGPAGLRWLGGETIVAVARR